MSMYVISFKQIIVYSIVSSVFVSSIVLVGGGIVNFLEMPIVRFSTADGKCVKVLNFKNGDAYSCEDVDVTLQRYRKEIVK